MMDFVDLDKVLDEFEEEEKAALSIVPGQELKPSGYIEFLQKHQEQDWASLQQEEALSSTTSGFSPEGPPSDGPPSSIAYDDPFEGFTHGKLGFIQEPQLDSLTHNGFDSLPADKVGKNKSELVTSLTSIGRQDIVVKNVLKRSTSEHKGTIASQTMEVQTDALSPASEEELMSLPFPRSDILVDGHGDTTVASTVSATTDTKAENESDQNQSPIYASVDSETLIPGAGETVQSSPSSQSSYQNGDTHSSTGEHTVTPAQGEDLNTALSKPEVGSDSGNSAAEVVNGFPGKTFPVSEQAVGFHDPVDEDLDDNELNMYLNELDGGSMEDFSALKATNGNNGPVSGTSPESSVAPSVPDIQTELSQSSGLKTRSLADEMREADSMGPPSESFMSGVSSVPDVDTASHFQDPDLVADLGLNTRQEKVSELDDGQVSSLGSSTNDKDTLYNSLSTGKMEIEEILDEKVKEEMLPPTAVSIGESLIQGKMEIERVLDEVVQNQQNMPEQELRPGVLQTCKDADTISSHGQPDVTKGHVKTSGLESVKGNVTTELSPPPPSQESHMTSMYSAPNVADKGSPTMCMGIGARPKDPAFIKKNRPNSLHGLSKINLESPSFVKHSEFSEDEDPSSFNSNLPKTTKFLPNAGSPQFSDGTVPQETEQGGGLFTPPSMGEISAESRQRMFAKSDSPVLSRDLDPHSPQHDGSNLNSESSREGSTEDLHSAAGSLNALSGSRMKRPTTLNLPVRPEFNMDHDEGTEVDVGQAGDQAPVASELPQDEVPFEGGLQEEEERQRAAGAACGAEGLDQSEASQAALSASMVHSDIGSVAPFWIPDAEAPACMLCQAKFTMWKRRHHCRACGKVLCATCCSQKAFLPYMENKEARVCVECHDQINSGSQRRSGEPKQVMFSDGIRPGGDLTELDGPDQSRSRRRKAAKKAVTPPNANPVKKTREESLLRSPCLVPEVGLPPLYITQDETGFVETDEMLNQLDYTADYKAETGPAISYAVNKNLSVAVKIINLDCCVSRICWSFVSRGMCTAGQSEVAILLELTEEEAVSESVTPPRDIFLHLQYIYEEALKGNFIQNMGLTLVQQEFLGSREYGGFLFLQPTFQCLNKLSLPEPPYLFALLLQKWEVPWAKVFPIRLLLRLGAEYRYYPCPLVSVRYRKPVFYEIGHTIINLLADFRNYQYMLTQIRGVTIHMENKKTVISFPRNRYDDVMKVVRNSNEHVMALGSSFSSEADSHLVCIQNEEGNYQTQAINIQNKPRLVTGASFVVFNGALKTTSGLRAKSSIVEDGLMIQVLPEALSGVKEALKDMTNHVILCGPLEAAEPDEVVELRWVDNDKNFSNGVKSFIDDSSLEGVESISVKSPPDVLGDSLAIRWTRVYFLRQEDSNPSHVDPQDLSRLTEDIAQGCCSALVAHLEELRKDGLVKLGLRVKLTREAVGYEVGSRGRTLPASMMNNLDTFLIPIIHQASEEGIVMELVFNIVD
ncbi:uncharacterized protein LOC101855213 isoform X2 [Aplysia californica]|uniref:Uncharacterized protein LOC101855213 isoform X2 n=1 Tax=Aplysia californica TaxID=6500 RepID=A0ABM0K379_APLCA|nr:uncharacterized protein LOC101855213 isoform X2 [Aplysia californica]